MYPVRLGVPGSTRGSSLQPIIDAIHSGRLQATIQLVVSSKSNAFILERAKQHALPACFIDPTGKTREAFDREVMDKLKERNIDLVLLIGYMRLLSPLFVTEWRHRVLNVHPSLLPAFGGGMDEEVHRAVLASGVKETGCTVHEVDEGIDTGPIVIQKKCPVLAIDTVETLKKKVQALEGEALIEAIERHTKG